MARRRQNRRIASWRGVLGLLHGRLRPGLAQPFLEAGFSAREIGEPLPHGRAVQPLVEEQVEELLLLSVGLRRLAGKVLDLRSDLDLISAGA